MNSIKQTIKILLIISIVVVSLMSLVSFTRYLFVAKKLHGTHDSVIISTLDCGKTWTTHNFTQKEFESFSGPSVTFYPKKSSDKNLECGTFFTKVNNFYDVKITESSVMFKDKIEPKISVNFHVILSNIDKYGSTLKLSKDSEYDDIAEYVYQEYEYRQYSDKQIFEKSIQKIAKEVNVLNITEPELSAMLIKEMSPEYEKRGFIISSAEVRIILSEHTKLQIYTNSLK